MTFGLNIETIGIFALVWIIIVYFIFNKKKSNEITLKYETTARDILVVPKLDDDFPRELKVNMVFENDKDVSTDVMADMTINMKDLLNGTYKVPDHLNKYAKTVEKNTSIEQLKELNSLKKEEVIEKKMESTIDINKLINLQNLKR